jgi:hypothetical protein
MAAGEPRDATLVWHIHDLHVARTEYDAAEVIALAQTIMLADAKAYGHQFPAYRDDPVSESLRAVEGLATEAGFAPRYATFLRDMVYGKERPDFDPAVATIRALASPVEVNVGGRVHAVGESGSGQQHWRAALLITECS